jgi:molybdopterin-guanine dinucleotide biosynthesis protein A
MGRDKALLPFRGTTLLEHTVQLVREAAGSVTLVGAGERYQDLNLPRLADVAAGSGPLAGILAALRQSAAERNLITACDMPGITFDFLRNLLNRINIPEADALIPCAAGRLAPLCAVYRPSAATVLETAFDAGERRVLEAIKGLKIKEIAVSPEFLANANTPAEWAALA